MALPGPRPLDLARDALFLDFDGTLVEIAPSPDAVRPAAGLADDLAALQKRLGGALAIVSGRPVAEIDHFLAPCRLAVAGLHGRDRRLADGRRERAEVDPDLLDGAKARLAALASRHPGLLVEDKGESVAAHYRGAPDAGEAVLAEASAIAEESEGALRLIPGKMVAELVPAGVDKGTAVEAFLGAPPFAGRVPVFVGDDVTDEAGFAAANRLEGLSVRIGLADTTEASSLLPDVPALHTWLASALGRG